MIERQGTWPDCDTRNKSRCADADLFYAIEDRTPRIYPWMNERVTMYLEQSEVMHCVSSESCNSKAPSFIRGIYLL